MQGALRLIILVYDPAVVANPSFKPLKSVADVQAGEASGMFQPIDPGGDNPYEGRDRDHRDLPGRLESRVSEGVEAAGDRHAASPPSFAPLAHLESR